jgi:hypothetical protein
MKIKNLLFTTAILCSGVFCLNTFAQEKSEIEIFQLASEPTIDGGLDAVWEAMPVHNVNQLEAGGSRSADADYGATFRIGWKNNKLFYFFDIQDDVHIFLPSINQWRQDYVVAFMNFNATHETDSTYGDFPVWWFRTTIPTEGGEANIGGRGPTGFIGIDDFPTYDMVTNIAAEGYTVELVFDLNDLFWEIPAPLAEGVTFGFDIEAGDVDVSTDSNSDRKHQLFWSETGMDGNWDNLSGLGKAIIREEVLGGTSVNEMADLRSVKFYPNPSSKVILFENLDQVKIIKILSITGQIVKNVEASEATSIDISGIPKGIYLVVFEGVNTQTAQKLIVE